MNGATLNYFKGGITQALVSKRRRFTRRPGKQHGKIISINSHPSSRAISKHNLEPRDIIVFPPPPFGWVMLIWWIWCCCRELCHYNENWLFGDVHKRGNSILHVPRGVNRGVTQRALLWGRELKTHVRTSRNKIDAGSKWNCKITLAQDIWRRGKQERLLLFNSIIMELIIYKWRLIRSHTRLLKTSTRCFVLFTNNNVAPTLVDEGK